MIEDAHSRSSIFISRLALPCPPPPCSHYYPTISSSHPHYRPVMPPPPFLPFFLFLIPIPIPFSLFLPFVRSFPPFNHSFKHSFNHSFISFLSLFPLLVPPSLFPLFAPLPLIPLPFPSPCLLVCPPAWPIFFFEVLPSTHSLVNNIQFFDWFFFENR